MERYVLVLDLGKDSVKSIGRNLEADASEIKKVIFKTKMYDLDDEFIELEGNSHLLQIDGKEFIIGEQGKISEDNFETTKSNNLHKYAAYTAISQYLEPNTIENKIYIVLACPLSVLASQEAKEAYKKLIKGTGTIKVSVDSENYEFEIADIILKQEDSGIIYLKPEQFINKVVALIGFGGLNMNFALYDNCTCQSKFSEELGSIALTNYTKESLTSYLKGNIVTFHQSEKALANGYLLKQGQIDANSIKAIEKAKERFFNDAMNIIKRHNYDIDKLDSVVIVGGTSLKIESIINRELKHSFITKNSQWDSVEGLYKIAIKKYGNVEM